MNSIFKGIALLTTVITLAFVVPACKKSSKNDTPGEAPGKIQGLGDMSGAPTGTDFALPANISVAGNIRGRECDSNYQRGSGELVDVCVALYNSSTSAITVTLPAGLFVLAENSAEYQHGIILQETKILVKAGGITRVSLGAFCVNGSKRISSETQKYYFGKVSDSKLVREVIALLAPKKINYEDYAVYNDYLTAAHVAQNAIWSVTDFQGIDAEVRTEVAALPNK